MKRAFLIVLSMGMSLILVGGVLPSMVADDCFACPSPPCAAPCILGGQPQVVCKVKGRDPFVTTFACCCCGSSENRYRPLE